MTLNELHVFSDPALLRCRVASSYSARLPSRNSTTSQFIGTVCFKVSFNTNISICCSTVHTTYTWSPEAQPKFRTKQSHSQPANPNFSVYFQTILPKEILSACLFLSSFLSYLVILHIHTSRCLAHSLAGYMGAENIASLTSETCQLGTRQQRWTTQDRPKQARQDCGPSWPSLVPRSPPSLVRTPVA